MAIEKLEKLLSEGAFVQARREAERMLSAGGLAAREAGRALRLACRASLSLQDPFAAARYGERALTCAQHAADPETMAMVHFDLGCAYTQIGDGQLAGTHLSEFLGLTAGQKEQGTMRADAHRHLGTVLRRRKQWQRATEALGWSASAYGAAGRVLQQLQCLLDIAWCHLMAGQRSAAQAHLAPVEAYLEQTREDALSAELVCRQALCSRLNGRLTESVELCHELFAPGRQGVGPGHLAEASWIMGENALDLGRSEEALLFATLALEHAVKANRPDLMNLAGDLRRRLLQSRAADGTTS